jgi:hypothetical protein
MATTDIFEKVVKTVNWKGDKDRLTTINYCLDHLISSLSKRTGSSTRVYVITRITRGEDLRAFDQKFKARLLAFLAEQMTVLLKDKRLEDHYTGLRILEHAFRWGLFILDIDGEPEELRLRGRTELHRGILDWILIEPAGAFVAEDSD